MIPSVRCDDKQFYDICYAELQSKMTEIALRIGMFEALNKPLTLEQLCNKVAIGQRSGGTIVTLLVAMKLLHRQGELLELSSTAREFLLEQSPFYRGWLFKKISADELEVIRSIHLKDTFSRPETARWLAGVVTDPKLQANDMHAHSFAAATVFSRLPVFSKLNSVLDVAGGVGSFSIALAGCNANLQCTVMDLVPMAAVAEQKFADFGLKRQLRFIGADMFKDAWPTGFQGIMFSNIFHDWDPGRCAILAKKAYVALPSGGMVFLNEMLLNDDKTGPLGAAMFAALMLLVMEGQQFTFNELSAILSAAGFQNIEKVSGYGYYTLISAQKP